MLERGRPLCCLAFDLRTTDSTHPFDGADVALRGIAERLAVVRRDRLCHAVKLDDDRALVQPGPRKS